MSLWRRHGAGPLVLALVASVARQVPAMVFPFDAAPPPTALGLHAYYRFYVYSAADAPSSENGNATVYVNLSLAVDSKAPVPAPSSELLQYRKEVFLAVVDQTVVDELVRKGNFCEQLLPGSPLVAALRSKASGTDPIQLSSDMTSFSGQLTRSGVYTLLVANCGKLTGFRIEGTVSVRNPHGFLQATEYNHLKFYNFLTAFYGLVLIGWLVMSLRWWQQLRNAQKVILGVAFLAMIESAMMAVLYYLYNTRNEFNDVVYLAASIVSAWKVCELFRIAIRALLSMKSAGATADEEQQGQCMDICLSAVLAMFMAADFNFREVLRLRAGYALSLHQVLLNASPFILMGTGIFGWSHAALFTQWSKSQKEQKDDESSLLVRSHIVLALGSLGALAATLVQLLDPSVGDDSAAWSQHVFARDGAHHAVFALVLLLLMWVWMPSQSTLGYEYQQQAQDMDGQPIGAIWNDDALDEETPGEAKREDGPAE